MNFERISTSAFGDMLNNTLPYMDRSLAKQQFNLELMASIVGTTFRSVVSLGFFTTQRRNNVYFTIITGFYCYNF